MKTQCCVRLTMRVFPKPYNRITRSSGKLDQKPAEKNFRRTLGRLLCLQ